MVNFGNDQDFIANYEELKSSYKMAELYHCTRKTVTAHARKIGYDYSKFKQVVKIADQPIEDVIKAYEELGSCAKVGERYGCSGTAVSKYLKDIGFEFNPNGKMAGISDDEFIAAYEELKSAQKVGELFGCSGTAVLQRAHKIGYDPNSNKEYKLSDTDKQIIIDSYFDSSSTELATKYNVSRGMITKLWHDAGLLNKECNNPKTNEKDLTGMTFGRWKVISKSNKRGASGSIYWLCRCQCGIEREVNGLSLRNGTSLSCGAHSNISKGNEKIKTILQEAGIPFEIEKKFDTCKDVNSLPFDFFVNGKYLIEYDGIQHFEDTIFDYEYTHKHDVVKNEWCKKNNILLIRIPYTRYDELSLQDLIPETSNFIEIMPT